MTELSVPDPGHSTGAQHWAGRVLRALYRATVGAEPALARVYYRTEDGWEAPLWRLEPEGGSTGEPVLVAHGLSLGPYACQPLAEILRAEGYDVYLLEHRGDRHAVASAGAGAAGFDEIASQDIPAALERIREVSGFARSLFVGHAIGGLLGYAHVANGSTPELAGVAAVQSPVVFDKAVSQLRAARVVSALLPERSHLLPLRALDLVFGPLLVRDVARWVRRGSFGNRDDTFDYLACLGGKELPAFIVSVGEDGARATAPARAALGPWASSLVLEHGAVDPFEEAAAPLVAPLLAWLETVRRRCW